MPIIITCNCGRTLRARDEQAGRACRCPGCGSQLQVPYPVAQPVDPPPINEKTRSNRPPPASALDAALSVHRQVAVPQPPAPKSASPSPQLSDIQKKERTWRGHVYAIFLLCIFPIAYMVINPPDSHAIIHRLIDEHPELKNGRFHSQEEFYDKLLSYAPNHRLPGALLPRDSYMHLLFAALSALVFGAIAPFAIPVDEDEISPARLLGVGLFTATIGISILLTFQFFSLCFCLVGIWYIAALDPRAPFGPSLLGFVLGVGVAEEITKVIPVLWRIHKEDITWRGACLIGMASGVGFGVAEGIHYSSNMYNGFVPASVYATRFISDVSFHAMLSAAAAIMLFQKRKHLVDWYNIYDWTLTMTAIMIVPICLHGLFDTMLKEQLQWVALIVWLATFGWLAWLIARLRKKEFNESNRVVQNMAKVVRTAQGTRYVGG